MTLLITAAAVIGWLVGYGVRGWEQREAERQVRRDAAVAAPDDGTFEAEYADAAYAEEWDDDAERAIVAALRLLDRSDVYADDRCLRSDHERGVHSNVVRLPLQRGPVA